MCVAMVIIYKKTLEKKGAADDVTSKSAGFGSFQAQTMSQGTALFSCGLMETSRWCEVGRGLSLQQRPVVGSSLESLWDVLPRGSAHWDWDVGRSTSTAISSLLQDLSLTEAAAASASAPSNASSSSSTNSSSSSHSTAPPSKRQCRSLSCSDDFGSCRSVWRPQGSRVWTTVEKRRCHSGGSVQRGNCGGGSGGGGGNAQLGFPAMQRSSSFSLPFTPLSSSSSSSLVSSETPLYLSHEQICLPEASSPTYSSPDSTPEMERRGGGGGGGGGEQGGLARSRSQPCVLNDKKIGVKRRRPADSHKQRPSLDLAKMTQKLRNFHSLSCPGITGEAHLDLGSLRRDTDDTSAQEDARPGTKEGRQTAGDVSSEPAADELDWTSGTDCGDSVSGSTNGKDSEPLWAGLCSMRKDVYQLGGEIDIEQIERN